MKSLSLYEVRLLDGTRYHGEIVYKDDEKIVLKMRKNNSTSAVTEKNNSTSAQRLRLFYNGIISIQGLNWWQRDYLVRDESYTHFTI